MKINPVTMREIRERFRRRRAITFLTLWIVLVIGLGYLIYLLARTWAGNAGFFGGISPMLISSSLGRIMFELVSLLLLTGMLLVVPGIASLSIVGERERLTLPLLQVSQLKPGQIVFGKLGSSLAYQLLLLISVAPIMLIPMLFGGVGIWDVLIAVAVIAVTSVLIGSISVWVSARAKSTRGAVAGAYLWTFAIAAVTALALIGEVFFFAHSRNDQWGPNGRELYTAWLNPYIAMASAVDEPLVNTNEFMVLSTPFDAIDALLERRQWGNRSFNAFPGMMVEPGVFVDDGFRGFEEPEFGGVADREPNRGPLWVRSLLLAAAITALVLWRAARHLAVPRSVSRQILRLPRRKEPADAPA
jgi:hypothetical protein